jgi:hypothetical protein
MPTGNAAEFFGNQLGKRAGPDNALRSRSPSRFCSGCGKKLRSRASRTDYSITTRCVCGQGVNSDTLCDLARAMERRHERHALLPKAPERPDPRTLDLGGLARKGDVETLLRISDGDAGSDRDVVAYRWLCVAADFGHRKAEGALEDLLETSSLRDDDGSRVAAVHRELAAAYARGKGGLPRDALKAKRHAAAAGRG